MKFEARGAAVALLSAAVSLVACAAHAQQQRFPSKPIRMIVPFSAGSQTDILARLVGQKMNENWGQQVVIDNRPSAGGTIAAGIVAAAPADGHTLMLHSVGHAINATLYTRLPFNTLRDFAGVSQVASVPNVLVVAPALGVKSVKDLIALAKQKPGTINFGSAGIGSGTHINGEQFKVVAGVNVVHVPYKGTPEALTDTMTGRIQYFFSPLVPATPFVKEGRLIALAVSTATRSPVLPDVPTVAEAALPGFDYDQWYGMLAPSHTPKAVLAQISKEIARVLDLPDVRKTFQTQGAVAKPSTPEQFDVFIRVEIDKLAKVIKASGARAD
jgi:tripartite-type tricarboxylate transporter receptor subunit TctC